MASWASSFYLLHRVVLGPSPNNLVAATVLPVSPPPVLVILSGLLMVRSRVPLFCFFLLSQSTHLCLKLAEEMYKGQNANTIGIIYAMVAAMIF